MNLTEIHQALSQAKATLAAADEVSDQLAQLLDGRLKRVTTWRGGQALARIKRELKDFDSRTQTWKGGSN